MPTTEISQKLDQVISLSMKMHDDITHLKAEVTEIKKDVSILKADVFVLKNEVKEMKSDIRAIKAEIKALHMVTSINSIKISEITQDLKSFKEETNKRLKQPIAKLSYTFLATHFALTITTSTIVSLIIH